MAIASLDELIAGSLPPVDFRKLRSPNMEANGQLASLAYEAGWPGAAVAPTPGIAGAALTTYAGQLPFTDPTGGDSAYLAYFEADTATAGQMQLYDRLWHNSGIVVTQTTIQAVNSVAFPARDVNGTIHGEQVQIGIEVSTATTNGAAVTTITMDYTNSDSVNGRTATITSFPATSVAGTFVPFTLQAGDTGIESIQSITLGTSLGAGAIHLVAFRLLSRVSLPFTEVEAVKDAATGAFPELYSGTVPFLLWLPSNNAGPFSFNGMVTYAQG